MSKIPIMTRKHKVLLKARKGETAPKEVEVEAKYARVNHRGDLLLTDSTASFDPISVAAFSSGSWISFYRE